MNKALGRIKPGIHQFEVIADIYHAQIIGFDEKFGDYTSLCPLIQVGEGTSTPHLTWTDEPFPDSGLIVMEGGIKIVSGGYNVGAVGVSGAPGGDKDAACAKKALNKLNERIEFAIE